jgi:hypothetical protein
VHLAADSSLKDIILYLQSFLFPRPSTLTGVTNIEAVLVHRDFNTQRMCLHSVRTKENLLNQRVSSVDAEASERSGSIDSEGISRLLQAAINSNGVSKTSTQIPVSRWLCINGTRANYPLRNW